MATRVFIQDDSNQVKQQDSLDGVTLADTKLLVVDMQDPGPDEVAAVGKYFWLHPVALSEYEKKASTPNLQEFPDHLFMTWDFLHDNPKTERFEVSTLIIFLGANYLVTMHAKQLYELDEVLDKLASNPALYRGNPGPILYAMIDNAVDEYFPIVENLTNKIDKFMENLLIEQKQGDLKVILNLKHRNMSVRRLAASHRDVVMKLSRRDTPFIPDDLVVYLLDVYDHLTRISSDVDNNSDLISSALDIHLNEVSNRMNVTMKRLTAVATIFMPLTFIVGLYGMNFRVPEYRWFYGYLYVWILMIVVSVVMIIIAKKSDWF